MKHWIKSANDSKFIAFVVFFISGFQNGYTYMARGNVFANLQTGNMILLVTNVAYQDIGNIIKYTVPLVIFGIGLFIGSRISIIYNRRMLESNYSKQLILIFETIIFLIVGLIPSKYNLIASALVSFNAALSITTFTHFLGRPMPPIMMIGNYRNMVASLAAYSVDGNRAHLKDSFQIFSLMLIFVLGGLCAALCSELLNTYSILVILPLLITSVILL